MADPLTMYFTNNTTMPLNKVPPKNYDPQTEAPDVIQPGDSPHWSVPAGSQTEVAYQIGSLSNTVIVDVTCANNDFTGFGGAGQPKLPNTYKAYINGGGTIGDGAYKIPPAQDWPNTDSGPNLGLTLSPTTYSDLNSAQQAAFSGVIAAADVIKAAPYEVDSFVDLITQFNGNQITVPELNDRLQKYSLSSQHCGDLDAALQTTFQCIGYGAVLLESDAGKNADFVEFIEDFASPTSTTTFQQLNTKLISWLAFGPGQMSNPNSSLKYSDLSEALQLTFGLLKNVAPPQVGNQPLYSQFSQIITNFQLGQFTVSDLNAQLQSLIPS